MSEPREIALLSQVRQMLAEASTIGDVKLIRDKAEAIRAYAAQQQYGIDIQNEAAELKIRAERRAGQLLGEMELHNGDPRLHDVTRLSDLGIAKMQSHRWQRVAMVPDAMFENHVETVKLSGRELTTAGVIKLAKKVEAATGCSDEQPCHEDCVSDLTQLVEAGAKFGTIYADPPWQYGNQGTRASTDNHYGTMPTADICALPVGDVAADDCHLHLWTTNAFLFEARSVIEAWGFDYKSVMVWVKPQMGIGNYWRVSHEFLLLGIRGNAAFRDRSIMSWQQADRARHSQKPELFRALIEKVSPGPCLEMFGRMAIPGWTVFGNQIEGNLYAAG